MDSNPSVHGIYCLSALKQEEGSGSWDKGQCGAVGAKSSLLERVYSFCSGKTGGLFLFCQIPKALSSSRSIFKFFYFTGSSLLGQKEFTCWGEGGEEIKKNRFIKGKTQAKRGNQ